MTVTSRRGTLLTTQHYYKQSYVSTGVYSKYNTVTLKFANPMGWGAHNWPVPDPNSWGKPYPARIDTYIHKLHPTPFRSILHKATRDSFHNIVRRMGIATEIIG